VVRGIDRTSLKNLFAVLIAITQNPPPAPQATRLPQSPHAQDRSIAASPTGFLIRVCGDICVSTSGWWRDSGALNASGAPIPRLIRTTRQRTQSRAGTSRFTRIRGDAIERLWCSVLVAGHRPPFLWCFLKVGDRDFGHDCD